MMWPAAWFIGVPAAGFLIAAFNWRVPFLLIGSLGGLGLLLTWRYQRNDLNTSQPRVAASAGASSSFAVDLYHRLAAIPARAWLTLLVTLFLVLSSENLYIVYAAWLEDRFGLTTVVLGVASVVIGLAEFGAEGVSAGWVDRIGKRRAVMAGAILNILAYLLLPQLAAGLYGALFGLFLIYLTYDFSIVSLLPLISELVPEARATMLALNVATLALARLIASLFSARLWAAGGLSANLLASTIFVGIALFVLITFVRERNLAEEPVWQTSS
jgi:predicted MFS family arabinose efflux permease